MENQPVIPLEKHVEKALSRIGAKVVKATEMSFSATKMLQDAQVEISDLYESLSDVQTMPKPEAGPENDAEDGPPRSPAD